MPHCGHTAKVPCGREPVKADCEEACERKLPGCAHPCRAKCAEECTVNCQVVVGVKIGSCGHEVNLSCFESQKGWPCLLKQIPRPFYYCFVISSGISDDLLKCNAFCDAILVCGHNCSGTCKSCNQGLYHMYRERTHLPENSFVDIGNMGNIKDIFLSILNYSKKFICIHIYSTQYECSLLNPPLCSSETTLTCEHGEMKIMCGHNVVHN